MKCKLGSFMGCCCARVFAVSASQRPAQEPAAMKIAAPELTGIQDGSIPSRLPSRTCRQKLWSCTSGRSARNPLHPQLPVGTRAGRKTSPNKSVTVNWSAYTRDQRGRTSIKFERK